MGTLATHPNGSWMHNTVQKIENFESRYEREREREGEGGREGGEDKHLVSLFSLYKGWLTSLLHEGASKCREAEVVLHDTHYLSQEAPQSSKIVLLSGQKVLEDATEKLQGMMS